MRQIITCLLCFTFTHFSFGQNNSNPREFEMQVGDSMVTMKQYYMVLLFRGSHADSISQKELVKLQEAHLANIFRVIKEGKAYLAGPFGDDTDLRGILVFDMETPELIEQELLQDPSIVAGRMRYEIHPWWTIKGSVLK